jgi:hypothetical protein
VEWISPVSTLLGAGIRVGATLLADQLRWRREREDRARQTRSQLYAEYSAALMRMRVALNEAAQNAALSREERVCQVRELFLAPGAHELRHQTGILAPTEVINASRTVFRILRDTRDAILEGAEASSAAYAELDESCAAALGELRRVMRRDLGVSEYVAPMTT